MSERYLEYLGPRQYGAKKTGERSKSCAIEKQQKVGISSNRKRRFSGKSIGKPAGCLIRNFIPVGCPGPLFPSSNVRNTDSVYPILRVKKLLFSTKMAPIKPQICRIFDHF